MTSFITGATGFIGKRLVNIVDENIRVLSRTEQPKYWAHKHPLKN